MARPIGIRTGPRSTLNDLPCRVCALRSNIASQIHIAGRISTSVSRQLDTSSLRPWYSITNAPIANASGANTRRELLSRRIASSTLASSFSSIARTSDRTRADKRGRTAILGGIGEAPERRGPAVAFVGMRACHDPLYFRLAMTAVAITSESATSTPSALSQLIPVVWRTCWA